MNKPKLHITLLGDPSAVERVLIRRCIDLLFLIYTDDKHQLAFSLVDRYSNLGVQVIPIHIQSLQINTILSSILRMLNQQQLDEYNIEFSISSSNSILVLATCVIAAIVDSPIIFVVDNEIIEISEIWPAKLINISHKKKQILSFLDDINSPINQKDIAGELDICPSGISRHIYDLELAGYVTRTRVAKKKVVEISDLGSAIIHQKEIRKRRIWAPSTIETIGGIQTAG